MERKLRGIAGTFILGSLLLAYYSDPNWLWLTAFVGLNLLQSSFTGFCPAARLFRAMGIRKGCAFE